MINPVLYVILNGDLRMSPGKAAAQAVHAAMMLPEECRSEFSGDEKPYKRTVIVLEAENREQMDGIADYLVDAGVRFEMYTDEGKNEVHPFALTALAVETIDEDDEETREIFSGLPLYSYTKEQKAYQYALAHTPIDTVSCAGTQESEPARPDYAGERMAALQAENRELRALWSENEGDIIELRSIFNRYLRLSKRDRLRIKPDDPRLITDRKQNETEEDGPQKRCNHNTFNN